MNKLTKYSIMRQPSQQRPPYLTSVCCIARGIIGPVREDKKAGQRKCLIN